MKKLFITLIALCSITALSAQNKNEMYVGGHIGVTTSSLMLDNNRATSVGFGIAPEYGYFAARNLRIGASVAYEFEDKIHTLEVMPNIAYYVEICDGFYYTPTLELGLSVSVMDDIGMPGFGIGLSLGSFEFRPTPKLGVAIDLLSLSYAMLTYEDHDYDLNITTRSVNFDFGVSPSIGIKYYF
ncbi:MAG: outer membrane beta-barrel protein [Alistipes sp.]|nr:outer membrane beta-barrel protein [Alistipes sp.]